MATDGSVPPDSVPRVGRIRAERFGAIIALVEPPALVSVDRAFARSLGVDGGALWEGAEPGVLDARLVAPTESHVAVTERCSAGCKTCYVDARPDGLEPPLEEITARLDALADAGVFRVAFGGGEAITRSDLDRIATYARERGLEPTLTTSGLGLTAAKAASLRAFAQVNVSYDGVGATYADVRGFDGAKGAEKAMALLAQAGVPFGVNFVLTRKSFPSLEETAARASSLGARELQLLRLKPEGRARLDYLAIRPSREDWAGFPSRLAELGGRGLLELRVDCSLVPFLADGRVEPARLVAFGVSGCEGGRALASVDVHGLVHPCSFDRGDVTPSTPLADDGLDRSPSLDAFRRHHAALPAPCDTCAYRASCRGGCRIVARVLDGDRFAADPECPRVVAYREARQGSGNARIDAT